MAKHEESHEVTREVTKSPSFKTTIESAPDLRDEEPILTQKTLMEQAAGRQMLAQYTPPPEEPPAR